MRSSLRLVIVAVVVAAIGSGAWLLWRGAAARRAAEQAAPTVDVLPDVAQRIREFSRVKVEDGRKVWEVSAREAQYREGEGTITVWDPVVAVYRENGEELSLRGSGGTVFLQGRELERVEVEGQIAVRFGEYAMTTEQAEYDAARDLVTAPGAVRIEGGGIAAEGAQMEVEVGAQRLRLTGGVHMTLWPRS